MLLGGLQRRHQADAQVVRGEAGSLDPDRAMESLRPQAKLDVDMACLGHGAPVIGDAAVVLRSVTAP